MNEADERAAIEFLRRNLDINAEVFLADDQWTFRWQDVRDAEGDPNEFDDHVYGGFFEVIVTREDLAEWWLAPGMADTKRTARHNYVDIEIMEFFAYHLTADGPVWFTPQGLTSTPPSEPFGN